MFAVESIVFFCYDKKIILKNPILEVVNGSCGLYRIWLVGALVWCPHCPCPANRYFNRNAFGEKRGLNEDHVWTVLLVTVPCAIIGARLYYVIFQWEHYRFDLGEIVAIWHGGLAIHGAILGGFFAVF